MIDQTTRTIVGSFKESPFAVVDGALFENLPSDIGRCGLSARSLFLDSVDAEIARAGPWLVPLDQRKNAIDAIASTVGARPAIVFWSCLDESILFRHLRSLTMARLPGWAAAGGLVEPPSSNPQYFETVFFRHYDPRVLGALLPVLDAGQFARFLGPASEIAFFAEAFGGAKSATKRPEWPRAPSGLLTIRSDQCEALIDRRSRSSRDRIAAFLREHASEQVSSMSHDTLLARVAEHEAEAYGLSVRGERSIGLWSYMQTTSTVDLSRDAGVRSFLVDTRNGTDIDDRMEALFDRRERILFNIFG